MESFLMRNPHLSCALGSAGLLQASYPVRDMIRRGWVKDSEASLLRLQIDRFFEAANEEGEPGTVAFAAKKTNSDETQPNQLAWVFRVRQLANPIPVPAFHH